MGSLVLAVKLSRMTKLSTLYLSLRYSFRSTFALSNPPPPPSDNKFLTATSIDTISDSLTKMTKLKQLILDMQGMDMSSKSANKFFNRLQQITSIEVLSINLK